MTSILPPVSRSRTPLAGALLAVTAACWAYLFFLAVQMDDMGDMSGMGQMSGMGEMSGGDGAGVMADARSAFAMPMTSAWTVGESVVMLTMWAVMMAAMMIPSAIPMIHAYDKTIRSPNAALTGSTAWFAVGYLAAWSGFATVATGAQWVLHDAALVDMMGASRSRWLGAPVLLAAGAYQFTALKHACLAKCRTPIGFLLNHWRNGSAGAVLMGLHHGAFCIGCCWALMALLFVLGVMNLWWIALVATVVLVEKTTQSAVPPRLLGAGLLAWGTALLLGAGG